MMKVSFKISIFYVFIQSISFIKQTLLIVKFIKKYYKKVVHDFISCITIYFQFQFFIVFNFHTIFNCLDELQNDSEGLGP